MEEHGWEGENLAEEVDKIGGGSVGGIAGEDPVEKAEGGGALTEAEAGLGFEEERGGALALGEIVGEEQHRGERGREVVDGRGFGSEPAGVSAEGAEKFFGAGGLTEATSRECGEVGELGIGAHAHGLEVAFEIGGSAPVGAGGGGVAGGGTGFAEPKVKIALVGE